MFCQFSRFASVAIFLVAVFLVADVTGQEGVQPVSTTQGAGAQKSAGGDEGPPVPKGGDVQARGPVHEAFATPTAEAKAPPMVAKKPPAPIEEMPPEEKPEGDMVWIAGYWAWDDDRNDYLWVSGCWRAKPHGKEWVAGYWREQNNSWQWAPGFWTAAQAGRAQEVTYY